MLIGLKCDRCIEQGWIITRYGCQPNEEFEGETCKTKDCRNAQCVVNEDNKSICTCDYTCPDDIVSTRSCLFY